MSDLISRQAAIDAIEKHLRQGDEIYWLTDADKIMNHAFEIAASCVYNLPSVQPDTDLSSYSDKLWKTAYERGKSERSEIISDTKAVPSNYDCVNLFERVTATFYDDEHEEWSQKTVTIRDVLDSSCDEYTVISSERKKGKWIWQIWSKYMCSECGQITTVDECMEDPMYIYCPYCGADMKGN